MKVLFIAGFGPIINDIGASRAIYLDTLQLPMKEETGHYFHSEDIGGAKHFALWPLTQAAESCFGTTDWPDHLSTPTSWIEFEVEDLKSATLELKSRGYELLVAARTEPWKQVVTRFLSPEGMLVGVTYTPWMREDK
jgi:hypothetical protein